MILIEAKAEIDAAAVALLATNPVATAGGARKAQDPNFAKIVLAKHFLVAMRRSDRAELRKAIHPAYLAKHSLVDQEKLPMEIAPVLGIHHLVPTLDGNSILCLYKTKEGQKESLLLNFEMKGDVPYIVPGTAPDQESGEFTPWILRQNLEKFIASK